MHGFQLTFFTQLGRTHGLWSIAEWILREAKKLNIKGATVSLAQGGYGRDGEYHTSRFFKLAGRPIEITMAVSPENAEQLFAVINEAGLKIFYMKIPVEYGVTGQNQPERTIL